MALEAHAPPSLLVDAHGTVVHVSETANQYLSFPSGTPSLNLLRTILPELRATLRTALYFALQKHQATMTTPVQAEIKGERRLVQLYVSPATQGQGMSMVLVVFADTPLPAPETLPATDSHGLEVDPRLRQFEEELEATKAQLQITLEASDVQQEELKAANEELQSMNEEYRSTLEELETSKEELQSINEELTTVNHELNDKVQNLIRLHNDVQNLMTATDVATLFVDCQLTTKLYTQPITAIFNIMPVDNNRPLTHVTHRLNDPHILRDFHRVIETLMPIEREVQRDDGRHYLMRLVPYFTTENRIDGVVATFVDITHLRQIEEQKRQSEEQFSALVEASALVVWTMNARGVVVEDSPSWRALTGQTVDAWKAQGWLQAVHPEDRVLAEANWHQSVAIEMPLDTELRLPRGSGEWRWMAVRIMPLRDATDAVRGWVAMSSDITQRKQAEAALLQREKLAALGMLLANVAHELNNPLAVAMIQLDNLQETVGTGALAQDIMGLRHALERCTSLVKSFLALAREQTPTRSTVVLQTVIQDVLVLLRHTLEVDGITVDVNEGANVPPLRADANQLHQVLMNLVTNAHSALRHADLPRHLTVTTAVNSEQTQVTLEVADTGIGIPEDLQHRVFEPFFTTKTHEGGSGLGLPLCRSIVESHAGTISVVSRPGGGTRVLVTLPVFMPADPTAEAASEPETNRRIQLGAILIVDDEISLHRALSRILEREGHTVKAAANGIEGLVALQEREYDVILCDMRMPFLDGPGFYHELERRAPHLLSRFIFLTGDVLAQEAQTFLAAVQRPSVVKPFKAQEVRLAIQQVLGER